MSKSVEGAGCATLEELRAYWRMPSLRATRELARVLGVIKTRSGYPWLSIWAAEGLAPPAQCHWSALKQPHLTAQLLADVLGESPRNSRRRDLNKPDATFPDPVPIRPKPKLWRAASVNAWAAGLPVPRFKLQRRKNAALSSEQKGDQNDVSEGVFDPWRYG